MIYITFNGVELEIPYDRESLIVQMAIDSTFDSGYFKSVPLSENIGDLDISRRIPRDLNVRIEYEGKTFYLKTGETNIDVSSYTIPSYIHKVNLISRTESITKLPLENIAVTQPKGDVGQYSRSVNIIDPNEMVEFSSQANMAGKYDGVDVYRIVFQNQIPYINTVNSNLTKLNGLNVVSLEEYKISVQASVYNVDILTPININVKVYFNSIIIHTKTLTVPKGEQGYNYEVNPGYLSEGISFNYTPTSYNSFSVEVSSGDDVLDSRIFLENMSLSITAIEVTDKPIRTNAQVMDKILRNTEYVLDTETRAKLNSTATENTYNEYTVYDAAQKIASEEGALVKVGLPVQERIWNPTTPQTIDIIAEDIHEYSPYDYDLGTILEVGNKYYENVETVYERTQLGFKYFDNPFIIDPVGEIDRSELAELGDYVSALELNTRNIIKPLRYSPFKDGWKSLRAEGIGQLTTDNILYEMEDNCDRIIQVKVRGFASQSNSYTWTANDETDITERVLEFKQYDTLDAESDYTISGKSKYLKNNTLYFTQGDNKILGMSYTGEHESVLIGQANVVRSLFECILAQRTIDSGELVTRTGTQSEDDPAYDGNLNGDLAIELQVIYSNNTESRARIYKDDQSGFTRDRIKYLNESASVNDTQAIGDYGQQLVNRLGGTKIIVSGVCNMEDVPDVGDKDSSGRVYTLIKLQLGKHVNYSYTLTQDYNVISSYIGTKSAHRVEEVSSSNIVNRTLRYTSKFIFVEESTLFISKILQPELILSSLFADTGGLNYGYLECGLSTGETKKIHMSLDSDSKGKTIEIKWKLYDNYSAGLKRYSFIRNDDTIWMITNVPYTDYYGKVNDILFKLYFDTLGTLDKNLYPEATSSDGSDLFVEIADDIDKDSRESIGGLVEIPILSEDDTVRVYNGMAKYNKLVQGSDRIHCAVLKYIPLRNAQKIDLSRAYDVTSTLIDNSSSGQLNFNITFGIAGETGLGLAFYNIDTLELCLVIIDPITFGPNGILRYWKIEDSQFGNPGDLPIQLEMVIALLENDTIDIEWVFQENFLLEAIFNDTDILNAEWFFPPAEQMIASFEDNDILNSSMIFKDNSDEPTVAYVTLTDLGGGIYRYEFLVTNNDESSAEIFADQTTQPLTSRGIVASGSSVTVYIISENAAVTLYARARANGESYSTVDSATGIIS